MLSLANKKISAGILAAASLINTAARAELALNLNVLPDISVNINETIEFIKSVDYAAAALTEKPSFSLLSEKDQKLALELYNSFDPEMKDIFLAAMDLKVLEGKHYAATQNDFKGRSFISNLHENCTGDLHPKLQHLRKSIIKSMLQEVCLFTELRQNGKNICGTSIVYDLYLNYPAEGLRILGGLLSPKGEVELLKPGATLKREPFSILPDKEGKTLTQRVMYSALAELANGEEYNYCEHCDQNFNLKTGYTTSGLFPAEQARLYKSIYNISDQDCLVYIQPFIFKLDEFIKQYTPGTIPIGMRWVDIQGSDKFKHNNQLDFETVDNHRGQLVSRAGGNVTVYHRVTILEVKDGRVYYHNLQGNFDYPNGTTFKNPPCRVEDNKRGIQSMEYKEFMGRINSFTIPLNGHRYPHPQYPKPAK